MCQVILLLLKFPLCLWQSNLFLCWSIAACTYVLYLYLCWCVSTYRVCKSKSITLQFIYFCGPSHSIFHMFVISFTQLFVYWYICFDGAVNYIFFVNNFTLFSMLGTHYVMFPIFYWIKYHLVNLFTVLCQFNFMCNLCFLILLGTHYIKSWCFLTYCYNMLCILQHFNR